MTHAERRLPDPSVVGTYSMAETCARLGIGTATGYDLYNKGDFPIKATLIGSRVKFRKVDVNRFLTDQAADAC
jgi:predicted DNA-binding transcriptional regulator AlpA